jgi:hypothetical protein
VEDAIERSVAGTATADEAGRRLLRNLMAAAARRDAAKTEAYDERPNS